MEARLREEEEGEWREFQREKGRRREGVKERKEEELKPLWLGLKPHLLRLRPHSIGLSTLPGLPAGSDPSGWSSALSS